MDRRAGGRFAAPRLPSPWPTAQFWLANIGLPGMLLGSVLPVGYALDRIGVLFGLMEAAAAVMFAVVMNRERKTAKTGTLMSSPAK